MAFPSRLPGWALLFPGETVGHSRALVWPVPRSLPDETQDVWGHYLLWVRKLPLAWPEPSQPGVGQVGPSFFSDLQEKGEPLREPSFCLRAANGQPDALLWDAYLPLM